MDSTWTKYSAREASIRRSSTRRRPSFHRKVLERSVVTQEWRKRKEAEMRIAK